jgi:thiol:disulfide interchange protein DsbD
MRFLPKSWLWILCLLMLPAVANAQSKYASVTATMEPATVKPGDQATLKIEFEVKAGLHAQSHKPLDPNNIPTNLKLDDNPAITAGDAVYPAGENVSYPALGTLSVYTGKVEFTVPITIAVNAANGALKISGIVRFQACNDKQCFMPGNLPFAVDATIVGGNAAATTQTASAPTATTGAKSPATTPAVIGGSSSMSFAAALGSALLAGLLFNIMPCVLPVLPLKAIGFYEVSQHNRAKSFVYGLVFSLGVISVFAVLALLVIVLKRVTWGELFSKAWFAWLVVTVLVLLSLGLFGGWTVTLPSGTYRVEPRHDTYSGNFFWGALTAVLATPCTAPLLPGLLAWATVRPSYQGVPAMLMVGVGMALPYLVLSATPELARRFPRSGPWPELFKQMMGFLMLAAAVYFAAGRLIEGPNFWWMVVATVAVAAFYLIARTVQLSKNALPVGISCILAVLMLGGVLGWTARITGIGSGANVEASWQPYSDQEFEQARASGKPVLVKFTANWCQTCQAIEGTVFRDPEVWDYLHKNNVVTIKADFSHENPSAQALLEKLNPAGGIPLTAIYAPGSDQPIQIASAYTSDTLLKTLRSILPAQP